LYYRYCKLVLLLLLLSFACAYPTCIYAARRGIAHSIVQPAALTAAVFPAHCCYCSVHIAVAHTLQVLPFKLLLLLSLSLHAAAASELAVVYTQNSLKG
jgi:ABC-type anion transport system duplicated permease subunit